MTQGLTRPENRTSKTDTARGITQFMQLSVGVGVGVGGGELTRAHTAQGISLMRAWALSARIGLSAHPHVILPACVP